MTRAADLATAIDALRRGGRIDRDHVEQALGVRLTLTEGTAGPFTRYGGEARLGEVVLDIDLREPVAGGTAIAGSLLNLQVKHGCPMRKDVENRFGPLAISNLPHGHSMDETTGISREEPWGRVTFGFAERQPDCLAVVTFAANR